MADNRSGIGASLGDGPDTSGASAEALLDAPLGDLLGADLPTRLAALEALGAKIAGGNIQDERDCYSGPELGKASVRIHRLCARLTGKRYQWLTVEEADGRWGTSAFRPRTFASHVAHTHHISYASAKKSVRLARRLRDEIPLFGAALRAGRIGPDHVDALASTALTSPTRIAALAEVVDTSQQQTTAGDDDTHDEGGRSGDGDQPQTVEAFLLEQACDLGVNQVRQLGKHFARVADPEADERGYRQAKEREYLELARTLDGWHLSGFLTEENGRLIRTAMDALMSPPAPDDQRTGEQRRAQALADLAHLALDQGLVGTNASVRPHLGVLIGAADLDHLLRTADEPDRGPHDHGSTDLGAGGPDATEPGTTEPGNAEHGTTGPGARDRSAADPDTTDGGTRVSWPDGPTAAFWKSAPLAELAGIDWMARLSTGPPTFDDGTGPVPPELLRRLATCGGVYRVIFGPDSEIINHGRERRVFTPAQRRALVARDKGCTWPGCSAPPVICESHHARIHWADGGRTDTVNGALLCFHHHALVDARSISMTRQNERWIFTHPDGTVANSNIDPLSQYPAWLNTG